MTGPLQAATASPTTPIPTRPARRLPPRWRNVLLTVHIVVAVGVLGTDRGGDDPGARGRAGGAGCHRDPGGVQARGQTRFRRR